ncbi:MAG: hypothetical protein R2941_07390 [Desulfobacterales bacterium]
MKKIITAAFFLFFSGCRLPGIRFTHSYSYDTIEEAAEEAQHLASGFFRPEGNRRE